jgi:hypothetical protein
MFVWTDTISSTLFGTTPLLHYNIDTFVKQKTRSRHPIEWLNGCPQEFIIWFAKLNSARSSIKQHGNHSPHIDWEVVEKEIREWEAIVDNTDLSKNTVTRLAVLEAWRQALLIYLYVVSEVDIHLSNNNNRHVAAGVGRMRCYLRRPPGPILCQTSYSAVSSSEGSR